MQYKCYNEKARANHDKSWNATIKSLKAVNNHYEMKVEGRGSSFYIIFGKYINGGYICIPEWNVGCEMASYQDTFWNMERLGDKLGKVDAITVVTAIKEAGNIIENSVM